MLSKVMSAGVMGVDGFLVTVECDTSAGLNSYEAVETDGPRRPGTQKSLCSSGRKALTRSADQPYRSIMESWLEE